MTDSSLSTHASLPHAAPVPLRSAMKRTSSRANLRSNPTSPLASPLTSPFLSPTSLPAPSMHGAFPLSPSPLNTPAPPTPGYTPKVSFDTFENDAASMFSYTLHVQSAGYVRWRATRVFLVAASPDASGSEALDWALDALAQDGDEIVVFRGIDTDELEKDHDVVREEARELMRAVQEKSAEYDPERKLSIIVEFIAGKITETIDRLIALYRPDSVVVGTRGQRGVMQAWGAAFGAPGMGSVSKYCLSHSPVPIIVVRPESKVRKAMAKRRANPKRGTHFETSEEVKGPKGSIAGFK